ncbi:MAG: PAS domain-containing protein [Candidatus Krumholzibacteriota bacterium]|nr:PAS domain-containing protein [Candidatus Krumholzibacteriota bacterium]
MRRRRILWHLFPYYVAVIIVALAAVSWYASRTVKEHYYDRTGDDLRARAILVAELVAIRMGDDSGGSMNDLSDSLGELTGTRFTVILPDGRVAADSEEDPVSMENHGDRPEIIRALAGVPGRSTRYSETLRRNFMYVAVPVMRDGRVAAAVRASLPLTFIDETLRGMYVRILYGGLVAAVLAGIISLYVSRRISRPIEEIRRGAEHFTRNDLDYRIPAHDLVEIADLAEVMNGMAYNLQDRILTVERQRNEQEAVFSSMIEGLIAVDTSERVLRLNRAASALLGVEPSKATGLTIQEVVRNPYLQEFVQRALSADEPVEESITLRGGGGTQYLQAHGAQLLDRDGELLGAVVVLNDVTRIRQLETLRSEFVANVSHELRTPITSIKGFVETLRDGAIHDTAEAKRFLGIISRQADKMNAIIGDLLMLSSVENEQERSRMRFDRARIKEIAGEAISLCAGRVGQRRVKIELDCPDDLEGTVNAALVEQALINLVDNAVTYSEEGGVVRVSATEEGGDIVIRVRDEGIGIREENLDRLFERFYRVDRARSRTLGGTGLGLAIVKHIAQAHGGSVEVESAFGEGSTFVLRLPNRKI